MSTSYQESTVLRTPLFNTPFVSNTSEAYKDWETPFAVLYTYPIINSTDSNEFEGVVEVIYIL
jgi:hypothetical protein